MNNKDPLGVGFILALLFSILAWWFALFSLVVFVLTKFSFWEWIQFFFWVWFAGCLFTWMTFLFNYKRFRRAKRVTIVLPYDGSVIKTNGSIISWFSDIFVLFPLVSLLWFMISDIEYQE